MPRWRHWRGKALRFAGMAIAVWAAVTGGSFLLSLRVYDDQVRTAAEIRAATLFTLTLNALDAAGQMPLSVLLGKAEVVARSLDGPMAKVRLLPADKADLPNGQIVLEKIGSSYRYLRRLPVTPLCSDCRTASEPALSISMTVASLRTSAGLNLRDLLGLHLLAFLVLSAGSIMVIERTRWRWRQLLRNRAEQDRALYERSQELRREMAVRERMARQLEEKVKELHRSNEELESFAYAASHDLQEPLRMVSSYAALVHKRYSDRLDQDGREFLGYMSEGARRMKAMIDDLLAYSRVDRGQMAHAAVDLAAVVARAQANLAAATQETATEIEIGVLPQVWGDGSLLARLLQNLIGNAIKYRALDRRLRILVQAVEQADHWVISVSDNGQGLPEEGRHRLFQLFQRFHDRSISGNGMGLAICRKIVERHNGEIWVESLSGHGATFSFTLPKVPVESETAEQPDLEPAHCPA